MENLSHENSTEISLKQKEQWIAPTIQKLDTIETQKSGTRSDGITFSS